MAILEFRTEMDSTPETVFAYVSELEHHGDWSDGQEIRKTSDGPTNEGSTYETQEQGPFGLTVKEKVAVTEYSRSQRFAWRSFGPMGSWYDWSFEIRPQGKGTVLVERLDDSHGLLAAALLKLFVERQMRQSMPQGLSRIKSRLEG